MLKIAISGKAGSGKNTVASILTEETFKYSKSNYKISAFANKIKQTISLNFPGCNQENLYGASYLRQENIQSELDKYIETDVSFREVSVDIGKVFRKYNPNFFIAHLMLDFEDFSKNKDGKLFIVSDLRFPNELDWARSNDFVLCRVKRSNYKIKVNDISEKIQDEIEDSAFDIVINNNSSIEELKLDLAKKFAKFIK